MESGNNITPGLNTPNRGLPFGTSSEEQIDISSRAVAPAPQPDLIVDRVGFEGTASTNASLSAAGFAMEAPEVAASGNPFWAPSAIREIIAALTLVASMQALVQDKEEGMIEEFISFLVEEGMISGEIEIEKLNVENAKAEAIYQEAFTKAIVSAVGFALSAVAAKGSLSQSSKADALSEGVEQTDNAADMGKKATALSDPTAPGGQVAIQSKSLSNTGPEAVQEMSEVSTTAASNPNIAQQSANQTAKGAAGPADQTSQATNQVAGSGNANHVAATTPDGTPQQQPPQQSAESGAANQAKPGFDGIPGATATMGTKSANKSTDDLAEAVDEATAQTSRMQTIKNTLKEVIAQPFKSMNRFAKLMASDPEVSRTIGEAVEQMGTAAAKMVRSEKEMKANEMKAEYEKAEAYHEAYKTVLQHEMEAMSGDAQKVEESFQSILQTIKSLSRGESSSIRTLSRS